MSAGTVWVPVTRAQFFAYMGPRDVHPRPERELTTWETRDRRPVGRSLGYAVPFGTPKRWELTSTAGPVLHMGPEEAAAALAKTGMT